MSDGPRSNPADRRGPINPNRIAAAPDPEPGEPLVERRTRSAWQRTDGKRIKPAKREFKEIRLAGVADEDD